MSATTSVTQRIAWSIGEVSATTGLSAGFVRKEIRAGRLRARRAGRRVLVLDRDLRRYLNGEPESQ
jgi:excisionase family DNA binding protein